MDIIALYLLIIDHDSKSHAPYFYLVTACLLLVYSLKLQVSFTYCYISYIGCSYVFLSHTCLYDVYIICVSYFVVLYMLKLTLILLFVLS